jgi:hypothetical protein
MLIVLIALIVVYGVNDNYALHTCLIIIIYYHTYILNIYQVKDLVKDVTALMTDLVYITS